MYYVTSGYTEPDKTAEFKAWLQSDEVEALMAHVEDDTGVRYIETYFSILGTGEYTFETWFELPDWAALDGLRESDVATEFVQEMLQYVDQSRAGTARFLRTAHDVKLTEPKEK